MLANYFDIETSISLPMRTFSGDGGHGLGLDAHGEGSREAGNE